MTITKKRNGTALEITVSGRLDTVTAPELEGEVASEIEQTTDLVFDFEGLEYISSAGLRVLLYAQKKMASRGKMAIKNANETVKEIFEVTGFCDILTVE